jgi:hypothetical protein
MKRKEDAEGNGVERDCGLQLSSIQGLEISEVLGLSSLAAPSLLSAMRFFHSAH